MLSRFFTAVGGLTKLRKIRGRKIKILIVRPDRIGDVVLSTPVFQAIKNVYPECEIHALIRDVAAPVIRHNHHVSRMIIYRPNSVHKNLSGIYRLWKMIRREKYDVAILLQVQWATTLAVSFSGIKYRIGPYSKWYSFLFFNLGVRQSRSRVAMHETDYNLMLLRKLGIRVTARRFEPTITVDADAKERMRELIKTEGFELNDPFVVVHPGMGGSALNWPEGYYVDMVRRLITGGVRVLVSGSTNEKAIIERVFDHAKGTDTGLPLHKYIGELTDAGLSDYIALISLSKVMVAPSTGPLHIATALGKRTVSFYPPVKVQSVLRWGPYSGDENRHITLVPDAICGQDYKCIGPKCSFYFCMERLAVDEAYHNVLNQLESAKNESIDQKTG